MDYKICLSKNVLIFYIILCPFIIFGSIANLLNIINGTGSVVSLGAFSLGGFILLPLLIFASYRNNLCEVRFDGLTIKKTSYAFAKFHCSINEYDVPFKDRPIFMPFKKTNKQLVIRDKTTNSIVFSNDLDISKNDIEKLRNSLPNY